MHHDLTTRPRAGRARAMAAVLALVAATGLVACDDGTGPEDAARVQIQLTDAPADDIASAEVWISRVYLQGGDDELDDAGDDGDTPGRVDLFNDPENPRMYDLLVLRDGVVADLTEPVVVESGTYGQLRLVVDSAHVTLVEGKTFSDGSSDRTLFVPSGAQSGIKVQLSGPIDAEGGETVVILVDFDVDRNFVFQGPADAPHGVLFTPTLVEMDRDEQDNDD